MLKYEEKLHLDEKYEKLKLKWKTVPIYKWYLIVILLGLISGIRPCAVISGSMEPNLPTWSLCFVDTRASYDNIQTGDIVVYSRRADGLRIIHRVIAIEPEGMITKGDANSVSDGLSVGRDNLYGKSLFHIPYLGYCSKAVKNPISKTIIIACFAVLLLTDVKNSRRKYKDK
ncbi:MAG: signal peptidase I [Eubacteriales bacterium]|nr:signal peptidase I [Eubacteriales bacterium]